MRQIQIVKNFHDLAIDYSNKVFTGRDAKFELPNFRLNYLRSKLRVRKHKKYIEYIDLILKEYKNLLKASPAEIQNFICEFKLILSPAELKAKVIGKKYLFYEQLVYAMRYVDVRGSEFLPYLKKLKLNTCIYCHSQFSLTIDTEYYDEEKRKKIKKAKAKLELDHFYPKSKYPFLCTSFFNLYPVCGNCNKAKSDKDIKFELYIEKEVSNTFNFWLDDASLVKYWVSYNLEDIKINFDHFKGDIKKRKEYVETFDIQGIYDSQKDVAEELIYKAKVYTESYKDELFENFKTLFKDKEILNRIILGNYQKEDDIYKRPLAKFYQDIAKQLNLIT